MQAHSWQQYQKLRLKKYRDESGLFLVEGVRLCREALSSGWKIEQVYMEEPFEKHAEFDKFNKLFKYSRIKPAILAEKNFRKLTDTVHPQGIAVVLKKPLQQIKLDSSIRQKKLILLLDEISDPGNMGTILRTADWFGVDLVVSEHSADIFNPKVLRASMGAVFHLTIGENMDLSKVISQIKKYNVQILGTSLEGKTEMPRLFKEQPIALLLGNEARGVRQELQDQVENNIRISGNGRAESLNVAVAAGILIAQLSDIHQ